MSKFLETVKKTLDSNGIYQGEILPSNKMEVYSIGNYVHGRKSISSGGIQDDVKIALLSVLGELRENSWYVSYYRNQDREFLAAETMESLLLSISTINPLSYVESILNNKCHHIEINLIEDFTEGVVSLEGVDTSYDSQRDFAVASIVSLGKTQYEYPEDNIYPMDFSDGSDGDYELFHGEELLALHHKEIEPINGRIYDDDQNGRAASSFWDDIENKQDWLKTVDPTSKVVVYHRKGKDWYVSPLCEKELVYFHYIDEDKEETDDDYEEIEFIHKVNPSLISKVRLEIVDFVKECIEEARRNEFCKELESSGYLSVLGIEDEYDAGHIILDNQENNSFRDTWIEVSQAMYDINPETNILSIPRTERKYSTIRNMIRMGKLCGLTFGKSTVIGSNVEEYHFASNDGHEYHFDPIEVIAMETDKDIVFTISTYFKDILAAFQKRRDRVSEFSMEDSQKVFVSIDDSLEAGNCSLGTYGLCQRHGLNPKKIGGIRGDALLDLEDNSYTRRAVAQAILRLNK